MNEHKPGKQQTRQNAQRVRFSLFVNQQHRGKVPKGVEGAQQRYHDGFQRVDGWTLDDLLTHISAGYGWAHTFRHTRRGWRKRDNLHSVQVLALDADNGDERATLAYWRDDAFFAQYGAAVHTTPSHTPDNPRCRPLFVLDEPVDAVEADAFLRALYARYDFVDVLPTVQYLYGAAGCDVLRLNNVLPVAVMRDEVAQQEQQRAAEQAERLRQVRQLRRPAAGIANAVSFRLDRYAEQAVAGCLDDVRNTPPGRGESHSTLRGAAVRLASLALADWHSLDVSSWRDLLLGAAVASGYVEKYGHREAQRTIDSAAGVATPAHPPALDTPPVSLDDAFFAVGADVRVTHPDSAFAPFIGRVERYRDDRDGRAFRVSGAWYPSTWLSHVDDDEPPDDWHTPDTPPPPPFSDSANRNIYAAVAGAGTRQTTVEVPPGAYLSDVLSDVPQRAIVCANTGIGKTTWALQKAQQGQLLLVTSTTLAVRQIAESRRAAGLPVDVHSQQEKTATPDSQLIVCCYESLTNVLRFVDASRFHLVVDEVHNSAASGSGAYRGKALDAVLDVLDGDWRSVTLLTGTPVSLSHPSLSDFVQVNVVSQRRTQPAQRVVWRHTVVDDNGDERTVGRKRDALLRTIGAPDGRRHFVYLNDKAKQLSRLRAELIAAGWAADSIHVLNSDTKDTPTGRSVVEAERLPADCQIVIATQLVVEAINLRDDFDAVHLYSPLHPAHAQQLVNRLRTAAAGVVYWYNAGDGDGKRVDERQVMRHWLDAARHDADRLNSCARVSPDDKSERGVVARQALRLYGGRDASLTRAVKTPAGRRYDVSYTAVDNMVFDAVRTYCHDNPAAFQRRTAAYGWAWGDDVHASRPAVSSPAADTIFDVLEAERLDSHEERVETVRNMGSAGAVQNTVWTASASSALLRTAQQVQRVDDALTKNAGSLDEEQRRDAFNTACDLVLDAADSAGAVKRTIRQIKVQRLRTVCDFTKAIYSAFAVGEQLTPDEAADRLRAVFSADEVMRIYAADRYAHAWAKNASSRLTQQKAVRLLRDLFTLKRNQVRVEGKRVWVYTIVDDNPLTAAGVTTLAVFSSKKAKSGDTPAPKSSPTTTPRSLSSDNTPQPVEAPIRGNGDGDEALNALLSKRSVYA